MKRFIVVGLGNFGGGVAEALAAQGHEVIAMDTNEAAVDAIARLVTRAAVGDGKVLSAVERAGGRDADAAVISTGDDITASILATLVLRDLGVRELYVKVISSDHARIMDKLGVTETIFPERESALRLATRMASRGILNYVHLGSGLSVQEMAVPRSWLGQALRDLALPKRYRISVIAVHDILMDKMIQVPDPTTVLKESDTLLVVGAEADLARVARET